MDSKWVAGYQKLGHALFRVQRYEEALDIYLKAIRVSNLTGQEITDQLVYQRAGTCFVIQKKWEDAKVMFLLAAESYKGAFSYFNLGRASYHIGDLEEAEKILGLANMMDSSRADIWGYLTLVLLRKEQPQSNAAYQAMNEAFKLGLNNLDILREISYLNLVKLQYKTARESLEYEMIVLAGPRNHARLSQFYS